VKSPTMPEDFHGEEEVSGRGRPSENLAEEVMKR
jgi:hypothetical protein